MENCNNLLHVEIMKKTSKDSDKEIEILSKRYLCELTEIKCDTVIKVLPAYLQHLVEAITFSGNNKVPFNLENIRFYIYKSLLASPEIQSIEDNDDGEEVSASNHWILPSQDFNGLWESLYYENNLKENLLKFIETSIVFSEKNIDQNIISCNRLVLLHGPPGTGKTSLCKALAQKVAIRLKPYYRFFHLVEVNSHSLFSKWFSESGKLVMKLFLKIRELIDTKSSLVCVLIDEVESIVYARDSVSNNEPSDSLRVVNAVLTQLDQIRKFSNVLVLTTSNMTSAIDLAFLDRADIKQFIGPPVDEAIYNIYLSAIEELIKAQIIYPAEILCSFRWLNEVKREIGENVEKNSFKLLHVTKISIGLSGRTLRKIPFLAHALHLTNHKSTMEIFLTAMEQAVLKYKSDAENVFAKKKLYERSLNKMNQTIL